MKSSQRCICLCHLEWVSECIRSRRKETVFRKCLLCVDLTQLEGRTVAVAVGSSSVNRRPLARNYWWRKKRKSVVSRRRRKSERRTSEIKAKQAEVTPVNQWFRSYWTCNKNVMSVFPRAGRERGREAICGEIHSRMATYSMTTNASGDHLFLRPPLRASTSFKVGVGEKRMNVQIIQ